MTTKNLTELESLLIRLREMDQKTLHKKKLLAQGGLALMNLQAEKTRGSFINWEAFVSYQKLLDEAIQSLCQTNLTELQAKHLLFQYLN